MHSLPPTDPPLAQSHDLRAAERHEHVATIVRVRRSERLARRAGRRAQRTTARAFGHSRLSARPTEAGPTARSHEHDRRLRKPAQVREPSKGARS